MIYNWTWQCLAGLRRVASFVWTSCTHVNMRLKVSRLSTWRCMSQLCISTSRAEGRIVYNGHTHTWSLRYRLFAVVYVTPCNKETLRNHVKTPGHEMCVQDCLTGARSMTCCGLRLIMLVPRAHSAATHKSHATRIWFEYSNWFEIRGFISASAKVCGFRFRSLNYQADSCPGSREGPCYSVYC